MATDVVSRVTTIITAVDKATAVVNKITARLTATQKTAHALGESFKKLGDATGLNRVAGFLSNISQHAIEAGKSFLEMLAPIVGLSAGGATILGLIRLDEGLHRFVEQGTHLKIVSERVGTTVQQLQELEYAARLVGVESDVLDTNLARFNKNLAQVAVGKNKEATKILGFLGISARDAHGHVRSAAQVIPQLADQMARIHNPAQRARVAVALFGKGGQALIPLLAKGGAGLRAAASDMRQLGEMTKEEADQAHELEVSQIRLHVAFDRVQEIIGSALAPYSKKAADTMREWIVHNRAWITLKIHEWVKRGATAVQDFWTKLKAVDWGAWKQGIDDSVKRVTDFVEAIGGARTALKIFLGLMIAARVGSFTSALWGLVTVLYAVGDAAYAALGPWGLLIAAVLAASVVIGRHWKASAHLFRYYTKEIEKYVTFLVRVIEVRFKRMGDAVNESLDRLGEAFVRKWREIEDNPLVRMLTGALGIGFGGDIRALINFLNPPTPPPGTQAQTPPPGTPPPPPAPPITIPYRPGFGPTGAGNGQVDVKVSFQNAPPGMRAASTTQGPIALSQRVNYSLPYLRTA